MGVITCCGINIKPKPIKTSNVTQSNNNFIELTSNNISRREETIINMNIHSTSKVLFKLPNNNTNKGHNNKLILKNSKTIVNKRSTTKLININNKTALSHYDDEYLLQENKFYKEGIVNIDFAAQKGERLLFIWIQAGIKINFTVEGLWSIDSENFDFCDSYGYQNLSHEMVNNFNCGALLGRIMGSKEQFQIYNKLELLSDISGPLFLSMNLSSRLIQSDNINLEGEMLIGIKNGERLLNYDQLEAKLSMQLFNIDHLYLIELNGFENNLIVEFNKLREDPILFALLYLGGETGLSYLPNKKERRSNVVIERKAEKRKKLKFKKSNDTLINQQESNMNIKKYLDVNNKILNKYSVAYPELCKIELSNVEYSETNLKHKLKTTNLTNKSLDNYKSYLYDNVYNQSDPIEYMDTLFIQLLHSKYNFPKFHINQSLISLAKFHAKDLSFTGRISYKSSGGFSQKQRIERVGKRIEGLVEIIQCYSSDENPLGLFVKLLLTYDKLLNKNLSEVFLNKDLILIGLATESHYLEGNVLVVEIAESVLS